jgi:hypothetical protein
MTARRNVATWARSLAGLLVSEQAGLFGFMEPGYRPAIMLSLGLEAATIVLLGAHLGLRAAPARAPRTGSAHLRPPEPMTKDC